MGSLVRLLRGERGVAEELARYGVMIRREGEVLEVCDPECRTLLGFQPSRAGLLVYYADAESRAFETLVVEDIMVLEPIDVREIVEPDGRVKPPSIWVHVGDPGLRYTRGRICTIDARIECKSL